jgi:hypothetical protein
LRSRVTVTIPQLVIEGTPPSPYTPGFLTEDTYVPEFPAPAPLPPHESVLDPNADLRVQKLTQDAQIANLVATGLGEPGSTPVLHAQSQSNLMTAFLLELQCNRKERAALEGKIRALEEKNHALEVDKVTLTNRVGRVEQDLTECKRLISLLTQGGGVPVVADSAASLDTPVRDENRRSPSPPLDFEQELAVDRGTVEIEPTPAVVNPGKRARDRSRSFARRDQSQAPRGNNKKGRSFKQGRFDGPQQAGPTGSGNPQTYQANQGRGGFGSNYQGRNFDPNFKPPGPRKDGNGPSNWRGGNNRNRRGAGPRN